MRTIPRAFLSSLLLLSIAALLQGCQSGTATSDADAKMRAAYQKKSYSLNDVPPEQRAMVEGFMKAGNSGKIPAPSATPQPKK